MISGAISPKDLICTRPADLRAESTGHSNPIDY